MSIQVALRHRTVYRYDRPVFLGPHVVRLRPAPHCRTPILAYSMRIEPGEHFCNWQQDPFGNWQARLVFPRPARELSVEVELLAELTTINPFDFFLEERAQRFPFRYEPALAAELAPYLQARPGGARFEALLARVRREILHAERPTVDVLVDVNRLVQGSLRYDIRMEPGVFAPDETLERGHGSCRDFAWLMVQLLRHLGLGARFVSGYSIQLRPDEKPLEGPAGVPEDVSDLHAWAEVYLPGAGWVGLDATSGLMATEGHIPLACTADPGAAAPVSGSFGWAREHEDDRVNDDFSFEMSVARIDERPRSTRPYTDAQWRDILACGQVVDRALQAGDVRLTMGGEPTFVSLDDPDGAEWNTEALGPNKARLGDQLLRRLARRVGRGGLLHHGQGKWYPGEPLPRWAYTYFFRRDGEPVWTDHDLIANGDGHERAGAEVARRYVEALALRLGVRAEHALPGYEDALYHLWRERHIPVNLDPRDSRLDRPEERERLRRIFTRGLGAVVGYALPLRAVYDGSDRFRWVSGRWFFRDEHLFLIPGDSPMGFRLPLDSLPWSAPVERQAQLVDALDPTAPRPALPPRLHFVRGPNPGDGGNGHGHGRTREPSASLAALGAGPGQSAPGVVRTALCVEPRDGTLHVFLPPVHTLEEYLDLVANVEETARALAHPVRIEGYPPPPDHRLNRLSVTPDPGVLEVNIHPAHGFEELVANTETLYEEARNTRLGTEKFMLDGRHSGTGGGNHIVLGGPTPADSPLLRRPDLLRSLVTYWNNHPSLSYLFSGLFVGPTSQAPRVDEARHDALDELELAFGHLPQKGDAPPPPWLVDRMLRHLLADMTGNTHRTEFSIDKLYSPDGPGGRQGLVELRGFEMPPHARMSVAQQLLVRALVAWLWDRPCTRKLVRWGTALVDRFMLPHFVAADFGEVIGDLREAGFPIARDWFDAHFEFRFPRHGRVVVAGIELELRQAIEPWHVLGEEPGAGGTVRFVDSSVERVQVAARGLHGDRFVLACNGRRVPLFPTDNTHEAVAGVRFKAWRPPSSLHPTLGVDTPLVFDLYDTWSERALGGCTYHVAHPGGRSFDTLPRNALEAESRRAARFQPFGHTPGRRAPPPPEPDPRFPLTLDLRRPRPR